MIVSLKMAESKITLICVLDVPAGCLYPAGTFFCLKVQEHKSPSEENRYVFKQSPQTEITGLTSAEPFL